MARRERTGFWLRCALATCNSSVRRWCAGFSAKRLAERSGVRCAEPKLAAQKWRAFALHVSRRRARASSHLLEREEREAADSAVAQRIDFLFINGARRSLSIHLSDTAPTCGALAFDGARLHIAHPDDLLARNCRFDDAFGSIWRAQIRFANRVFRAAHGDERAFRAELAGSWFWRTGRLGSIVNCWADFVLTRLHLCLSTADDYQTAGFSFERSSFAAQLHEQSSCQTTAAAGVTVTRVAGLAGARQHLATASRACAAGAATRTCGQP